MGMNISLPSGGRTIGVIQAHSFAVWNSGNAFHLYVTDDVRYSVYNCSHQNYADLLVCRPVNIKCFYPESTTPRRRVMVVKR